MDAKKIYQSVQSHYGNLAQRSAIDSDAEYSQKIAQAFGYGLEELTSIPEGANLGASCGNPFATARLKEREVVIDLGSGAGFDVFLAAKKVGLEGKAIGIDINKHMLTLAHTNLKKFNASNISFIEASITSIPLPSETADCIISNCVINLVPETDKPKVFREMFRLLKPGGRVAISDLIAKKELPVDMKHNIALYVGCIAGASLGSDYEKYLKDAGFQETLVIEAHYNLNMYKEGNHMELSAGQIAADTNCCSSSCCASKSQETIAVPSEARIQENSPLNFPHQENANSGCCAGSCCGTELVRTRTSEGSLADVNSNEWIASAQIYAVKPSS